MNESMRNLDPIGDSFRNWIIAGLAILVLSYLMGGFFQPSGEVIIEKASTPIPAAAPAETVP